MALKIRNQDAVAKATGKGKEDFKKNQIKAGEIPAGEYEVTVKDTRLVEDQRYGEGYFIDYTINRVLKAKDEAAAAAIVGKESSWGKFPENAKGGTNAKTGKSLSAKQAREKDEIAVQVATAALFGFTKDQAGRLGQDSFDSCYVSGAERGSSPCVGYTVIVKAITYGPGKVFTEIHPVAGETKNSPALTTKAPPAAPAKPKPTFQAAYSAAGWEKHPDAVGWYYNESTGEQLDDEDLKTALGF